MSKIMKRREGAHVGKLGDNDGVGIFEQFIYNVAQDASMNA